MSGGGRPFRAAIVGSGPSGFYAAEAILRDFPEGAEIDMIDRLPTPFGLVRGGVAPDHQKIKSVTAVYEKIASGPRFRFFGNVRLGKDFGVDDLRSRYDAVIYAVGCESDRSLGIPGEELEGSRAATEFVGWYNGHPDHRDKSFDLSCRAAAVVGIGNVAMDVARVLAKDPKDLAATDIAEHALTALRDSKIEEIILLGRRGPLQAAFSPKEIEELSHIPGCDLSIRPEEAALDPVSLLDEPQAEAADKKNAALVLEFSKRAPAGARKKIRLRFLASPVEILGENGRVSAVRIEKNRIEKDSSGKIIARGTGSFETIPVGLILRSVGYFGVPIDGVPFDSSKGIIPNDSGRVLSKPKGERRPGEYVVGWAKRGPSGLIGTNRADSAATVAALIEDFGKKERTALPSAEETGAFFLSRQPRLVRFSDWKRLDALELAKGRSSGKIREKFTRVPEMLAALEKTAV